MVAKRGFCDAHMHLSDLLAHQPDALQSMLAAGTRSISSCHSRPEIADFATWLVAQPQVAHSVACSFGIHPQNPVPDELDFLYQLARRPTANFPRLAAIGECGYDFFQGRPMEGPFSQAIQDELFLLQVELAQETGLPLIVHLRRGTDMIFRHAKLLSRLSAVVFHSWPSPPEAGLALLARGINAFFSLGTPLLRGKKSAQRSLVELPFTRILMESDAPYQSLKGKEFTDTATLGLVYAGAAKILNLDLAEFVRIINANFDSVFLQTFAI